jgi:hypothetical protein
LRLARLHVSILASRDDEEFYVSFQALPDSSTPPAASKPDLGR